MSKFYTNQTPAEKVLLVIVEERGRGIWPTSEIEQEMRELVMACGGIVVDSFTCRLQKPSASFYVSEGRVEEIAALCSGKDINTIVFSHDLKGSHQRNIEEVTKVKTIDRTQLILDIFARHATSQEGKMQVELAQLEYLMPRLVGKGIELSRQGGGIGTLGPGETKLEVDRRRIEQKIGKLKRGLSDVSANRSLKRKKRIEQGVASLSIVGYTNAGKSSLLNALTNAEQKTRDGLFTTLDSLSRQYILPNRQKVVVSDTVGFMRELPHHLIESFKATLEEVKEADLLLHVVDVSQPNFRDLHEAVMIVLAELGAQDKPIITVLNKIDLFTDKVGLKSLQENYENAVCISVKTQENFDQLNQRIIELLSSLIIEVDVNIPIERMDMVNRAHEEGQVYSIKYYRDTVNIRAAVPPKLAGQLKKMHAV